MTSSEPSLNINGETRIAGIVGSPIKHSKSLAIYNQAFARQAVDAVYLAFETCEAETIGRIEALKNLDALLINVTMPGKHQALACVDHVDQAAAYVQAVNTIVKQDDGWWGYNTDGLGFWQSACRHCGHLPGQKITIFGTGSTSRVILAQAVLMGARQIKLVGRQWQRPLAIKTVIEKLRADFPDLAITCLDLAEDDQVKSALNQADIVVQTTSVGMVGQVNQSVVKEADWFSPHNYVFDIIYEPDQTVFLGQAKGRGCQAFNGLLMLWGQAEINYQLATGKNLLA
ncbi:hypothetical protein AWM75_01000 [Aerococcus urinaehominis]|uniref:Uncharacterized protein n=1 Tax=Aerococcus urinaehominis TaxID=128944 RepID=A0A0X8FJV6_9LACT|nr:shikimate dehydrogenase [Aerococcus urinaehominis]AMB98656.1 hypothetical protein AWM75_01000 [Aerococcus urinaehominis]SDL97272.1 shikimate dehydrogenase [Aerococcus urinaehominis]